MDNFFANYPDKRFNDNDALDGHDLYKGDQAGQQMENDQEEESLLDLNEVMQAFGVTTWENRGPLEEQGRNTLALLVDIEGERYILRERPEGLAGEDIQHRYSFQEYLQQSGIPVPSFRKTPQGQPFVIMHEDAFELQRWISGEHYTTINPRSLEWGEAAARTLGQLHQASQRYPGPRHQWPPEAQMGSIVQGYLNLARATAQSYPLPTVAAALQDVIEHWEAALPAAMVSIGSGSHLPELHIHGDYHAMNLRFDRSGVVAVQGLEASRWEKRLFEVAYALFSFSAIKWLPGETLTAPLVKRGFEPERMKRFLQAYHEVFPPTPEEAVLLADALVIMTPIAVANGPLEDLFYATETDNTSLDSQASSSLLERLEWAGSLPQWLSRIRSALTEMWQVR